MYDTLGHECQMMGHPMGEIWVMVKGHNERSNMSDLRGIGESLMFSAVSDIKIKMYYSWVNDWPYVRWQYRRGNIGTRWTRWSNIAFRPACGDFGQTLVSVCHGERVNLYVKDLKCYRDNVIDGEDLYFPSSLLDRNKKQAIPLQSCWGISSEFLGEREWIL